ncbi:MAG: RNA polymerase sigma factor [Candidatus Peregrinibacteria bacterium GW2011_GWA2_43_8]|nr:MAG: RNA polymerase sigma factor [Candidatus Peregrinibacteria bacterium GW2011_GWA2_43_8]
MARTRKFITGISDEKLAKFPPEVRALIEKGKQRGFVTHQELVKAVPSVEEDVMLLDEIYAVFMDLGIKVMDVKDSMIWGDNAKEDVSCLLRKKRLNLREGLRKAISLPKRRLPRRT